MEKYKKTALITGANGQTASYLAELLLEKGYKVYGTVRRNSVPESQTTRIQSLHESGKINLIYMDLTDPMSVNEVVNAIKPDELYHLAAQSHVQISFELPKYTLDVNAGGTLAVLEAVRRFSPETKMYHASTSETFGNEIDLDGFQRESTKMAPVSPYGCSKLYAHNLVHNYRNSYGIFAVSGILFNHESPRRGINFVTNKVALGAVKIKKGLQKELRLGTLDSWRDWSHAKDMARGIHAMLQNDEPLDYVLASGKSRTVRDMVKCVFDQLDLDWEKYVVNDQKYERPEELWQLRGDATRARTDLGWDNEISFEEMMKEMVDHWMNEIK